MMHIIMHFECETAHESGVAKGGSCSRRDVRAAIVAGERKKNCNMGKRNAQNTTNNLYPEQLEGIILFEFIFD